MHSGLVRTVGSIFGLALLLTLCTTAPGASARTVYPGSGTTVYLGGGTAALAGTSTSFRRFVHRQLVHLWASDGKRSACRNAPEIVVGEYRHRVAFFADEGLFADHAPQRCASGGNWQFAVRRHGHWTAPRALGGQDTPSCATLRSYDIPRMTGAQTCVKHGKVRNYFPSGAPRIDWTADSPQRGETACGMVNDSDLYVSGWSCAKGTAAFDAWSSGHGMTCTNLDNGLSGCNKGDTSTIGKSTKEPYVRGVRPGGATGTPAT